MNIEKKVIDDVFDYTAVSVNRPAWRSVDGRVSSSVWQSVSDRVCSLTEISLWRSVRNTVENSISDYEY